MRLMLIFCYAECFDVHKIFEPIVIIVVYPSVAWVITLFIDPVLQSLCYSFFSVRYAAIEKIPFGANKGKPETWT